MYLQKHEQKAQGQDATAMLWQGLENRNIRGYEFERQRTVGEFVMDFYCEELNLVIAVDSKTDFIDVAREKLLKQRRMSFMRFEEEKVEESCDKILKTIDWFIDRYEKLNRLTEPNRAMAIAC